MQLSLWLQAYYKDLLKNLTDGHCLKLDFDIMKRSCRRYGLFTCTKTIVFQEPQTSAKIDKEFRSAKARISAVTRLRRKALLRRKFESRHP